MSEDRARGAQARGDYSAGSYYIKGEVEDHVNEYTTKLRISRSSGGWAGLIWSGTPDSFALRLSGLQVDGRGFRYRVRAIGPGGEILAVKACRADFKGNPDVLPYECLFETGPPGIRGKVQTGFLIRDRGQRIVKYRVPAQPVRFCFIDTVRDE